MTGRLAGKTAFITGSDSGIGQATAIEFGREGADVVVHYLHDHAGANHTKAEIEKAGRRSLVVQGDISVEHQVEAMFEEALAEFGTLEILTAADVAGWISGLVVSIVTVTLAAMLWQSRRLTDGR